MAGEVAVTAAVYWCKTCDEPVNLTGSANLDPELRKAVHESTGLEEGPGGKGGNPHGSHIARPTDMNPALKPELAATRVEFGEFFRVSGRFGIPTARWRPELLSVGAVCAPITAPTFAELRTRLRAELGR